MDGVIEMANVDYPHRHTDEGDDLEDRQSQSVKSRNSASMKIKKKNPKNN